jgi:hypothetical protein
MSFELKPQTGIGFGMNVEDIVWTQPRSPLPPLLADRVSLSQWQGTWDAVQKQYDKIYDGMRPLFPWIYIPCCVCCTMSKMIKLKREVQESWVNLVLSEQEKYRSVGVQVTLARELYSYGAGSSRHMENEMVGLRFEIAPNPGGSSSYEISNTPNKKDSSDLVAQLEKLNALHKAGALSYDEYEKAKAKLLS